MNLPSAKNFSMKPNFLHSLQSAIAKLFLFAFIVFCSVSTTHGQNASLGFYNTMVSPNAVHYYDSIPVSTTLKNYSIFNFQGTIQVRYSVNNIVQPDTVPPFYFNNFPANDTQNIFFVLNANPLLGFADGDNYVVIWPVSLSGSTHDSASFHIIVDTTASIRELTLSPIKLTVFGEKIYFHYTSSDFIAGDFTLLNMLGEKVVCINAMKPDFISIADLPAGIYLLNLKTAQRQFNFKIWKQ